MQGTLFFVTRVSEVNLSPKETKPLLLISAAVSLERIRTLFVVKIHAHIEQERSPRTVEVGLWAILARFCYFQSEPKARGSGPAGLR